MNAAKITKQIQHEFRTKGRTARNSLNGEERDDASEKIAENVIRSSWFQRSKYLACYLPLPGEVDTWRIIARAWRMKKRIFAPVVEKNGQLTFREITSESDLYTNHYGLSEPRDGESISARMLDIVITPLVAFDSHNHRIGMGGGYFDRTFSFLLHRSTFLHPKLIGIAFACQEVEKISSNPWDIRLFRVVTELS
jgi:5-formyltetrahydrofolate cyclo-ligase